MESGRDSSSYIVVWVPVSNGWRHWKTEASLIKPLNNTPVHVPSRKKVGVRCHHPKQECLNFIDATGPL